MKNLILPGSKSITNRDLILASLTSGKSNLNSILDSDDTRYMIEALKNIGIEIENDGNKVKINGGIEKLKGNNQTLYIGQSGTCMRFLTTLIVLNKSGNITLTGEKRLLERPLRDLIEGIKQIGIKVESNGDLPPIKINPSEINNNKIKMRGNSSSQFFTAFLMIAPCLENGLEIEVIGDMVSKPYIDITINEMNKFGVTVENKDYKYFIIKHQKYNRVDISVEGDASALSYIANFIVLHLGEIKINNLGNNSKQGDYKYLDILKNVFGLEYKSNGEETFLKCRDISTKFPCKSEETEFDFEDMPDISMSFMSLAIFLPGQTKITGLQTLNLKECKRIDAMRDELMKLGVQVESDEKSITIGKFDRESFEKIVKNKGQIDIETYNDHRIAMVFGVLNTILNNKLNILNPNCVNKTYPKFWEDLEYLQE